MVEATLIAIVALALLALEKRANGEREKEWATERQYLLQRIQDPQVAVAQHAAPPERELVFEVPFDDDETFNNVMAGRSDGST